MTLRLFDQIPNPVTSESMPRPLPDFSGKADPTTARLGHLQVSKSLRDGVEHQQMADGVADLGDELARSAAVAAAIRGKRHAQAAKPRRMSSRQAASIDVSREAVKRKPGLCRVEPTPADAPEIPVPRTESKEEARAKEREKLRLAYLMLDDQSNLPPWV